MRNNFRFKNKVFQARDSDYKVVVYENVDMYYKKDGLKLEPVEWNFEYKYFDVNIIKGGYKRDNYSEFIVTVCEKGNPEPIINEWLIEVSVVRNMLSNILDRIEDRIEAYIEKDNIVMKLRKLADAIEDGELDIIEDKIDINIDEDIL